MSLTERLAEYRAHASPACGSFRTKPKKPSARLPPFAVSRAGSWPHGTSMPACTSRPAMCLPTRRAPTRWQRSGHSADPGRSARNGNPRAGELSPVPRQSRNRPGLGSANHARQAAADLCRHSRTVIQIPPELETLVTVIEHPLPDRGQLPNRQAVAAESGELPEGDDLGRVLDAAAGLTRFEAENVFSLALVREGQLEPETIWQQKCQTLKRPASCTCTRAKNLSPSSAASKLSNRSAAGL